jgi:hypothetical protein
VPKGGFLHRIQETREADMNRVYGGGGGATSDNVSL